jgi:hypothetical protein
MSVIQLIGINFVYDPANFPFSVSWEGIDSPARNIEEAHALALCRVKYTEEDSVASVYKVKDTHTSTMVKQITKRDGELDVWNRKG